MEASVRYNIAHKIIKVNREVPKKVMSCETSDVSQFHNLEKFKQVMFCDETALFPEKLLKFGHSLGPSIDIHPSMTTKILTDNGQVLLMSKY